MSPIISITIWLACSLSLLILLFFFKNGRKERLKELWLRLERIGIYRSKKAYTREYLRQLRTKMIKPKTTRALIPLFIMLVVVFLLLNNFVFFAVITSDSMSPTFSKGDMVLMTEIKDIQSGDIIMFNVPQEPFPVVHRVSNIQGENISTKGDFNYKEDLWTINNSMIRSEAVTINGKPIVIKGIGTYFIDEHDDMGRYTGEIEFNRLLLTGVKDLAVFIFFVCVTLYLFFTVRERRQR